MCYRSAGTMRPRQHLGCQSACVAAAAGSVREVVLVLHLDRGVSFSGGVRTKASGAVPPLSVDIS